MGETRSLTQEQIWQLLEGHQDVLGPLAKKEQVFFRNIPCPSCGSYSHGQFVNPRNPFSPGSPLPNTLLRCANCQTEWEPHSGLITAAPIAEPD